MSYIWHGTPTQSIERLSIATGGSIDVHSTVGAGGQ